SELAVDAVFPEDKEQRCWNHRILKILDKLPLKRQAEARSLVTTIPYAAMREAAKQAKRIFQAWAAKRGQAEAGQALDRNWERLGRVLSVPARALEAPADIEDGGVALRRVRLRTAAAKRVKKVEKATAVIWKTLLIAEKNFRRLDAPELLADVASGAVYVNGVRAVKRGEKRAAA